MNYFMIGKEFQIYVINSSHFFIFPLILFNVARLYHIEGRLLKFPVVILDMIMRGTVSQNYYLGPSLLFM